AALAVAGDDRTLAPLARRAVTEGIRGSEAAPVAAAVGRALQLLECGDDVPALLRAAVVLEDWPRVRDVLSTGWPRVAVADPELLRTTILALPEAIVARDVRARAVRAMYAGLGPQDRREPIGLRRVGQTIVDPYGQRPETLDALGRGTLAMIQARIDGRWSEASAWADALDRTWQDASEDECVELGAAAHLLAWQWGLTR